MRLRQDRLRNMFESTGLTRSFGHGFDSPRRKIVQKMQRIEIDRSGFRHPPAMEPNNLKHMAYVARLFDSR
jgi:hypothetical protein